MCNQLHNRGLIIDIQKFMTISCSLSICLVMFFIVQEFNCYINACLKGLWMMTSSHCKVFVQLTQMNINKFLGWLFWTHDKKKNLICASSNNKWTKWNFLLTPNPKLCACASLKGCKIFTTKSLHVFSIPMVATILNAI